MKIIENYFRSLQMIFKKCTQIIENYFQGFKNISTKFSQIICKLFSNLVYWDITYLMHVNYVIKYN